MTHKLPAGKTHVDFLFSHYSGTQMSDLALQLQAVFPLQLQLES